MPRRPELVDGALQLAIEQSLQNWLSSVDTRAIAESAGVTTGSFFHHFRNRAVFTDAVVHRFDELWDARVAHLVGGSQHYVDEIDPDVLRTTARSEWAALEAVGPSVTLQHLLWVARRGPIAEGTDTTGAEVLRRAYTVLTDASRPFSEAATTAVGREMLPPFSSTDLTVLVTALAEGLQMRAAVDPDAVRTDLYADATAALWVATTRPIPERRSAREIYEPPTVRSGASRAAAIGASRSETWREIAEAAAHLFAERSPADVRMNEVAAAAGVSPSTVYHHFRSVWAVAAAGFVRHLDELTEISTRPLTTEDGPIERIREVLCRYVELLQEHRGVAEALISETAREVGVTGAGRARSLRATVPLADLLFDHIRELRARGLLRRRVETERLGRSLLQLTTVQSIAYVDDPPKRIVDDVLTLVLDGALAVEGST